MDGWPGPAAVIPAMTRAFPASRGRPEYAAGSFSPSWPGDPGPPALSLAVRVRLASQRLSEVTQCCLGRGRVAHRLACCRGRAERQLQLDQLRLPVYREVSLDR